MVKEYLLSTNDFLEPESIKGTDAIGTIFVRLLMMNPGTNPLHPGMGVGIGRYKFISEDDIGKLKTIIESQCTTYMPSNWMPTDINVTINEYSKALEISAIIDGTIYVYNTQDTPYPVFLSE